MEDRISSTLRDAKRVLLGYRYLIKRSGASFREGDNVISKIDSIMSEDTIVPSQPKFESPRSNMLPFLSVGMTVLMLVLLLQHAIYERNLRDQFAMNALQGMSVIGAINPDDKSQAMRTIAEMSYRIADEMMIVRNKGESHAE